MIMTSVATSTIIINLGKKPKIFCFSFQYLAFVVVGVGTFFNVIFHLFIKEPPCEALLEREKNEEKGKNKNKKWSKSDKKGSVVNSAALHSNKLVLPREYSL